jgi:hypothetical protein
MYAFIRETGRRFFEVVCAPSTMTAHLHDPPPLPLDSRTALFQLCSKSNTAVCIQAFWFFVSHQLTVDAAWV